MFKDLSTILKAGVVAAMAAGLFAGVMATGAEAAPQNKGQPADTIHPNIHGKVGQKQVVGTNKNANPNGNNGESSQGGGLHGIHNAPGQDDGDHPNADGTNGQSNELQTMHGGIGQYNKNALP